MLVVPHSLYGNQAIYFLLKKLAERGWGGVGGGEGVAARSCREVHPSHPPTKLPLAVLFVFAAAAAFASKKLGEKKIWLKNFLMHIFFKSFISTCFEDPFDSSSSLLLFLFKQKSLFLNLKLGLTSLNL